MSIATLRLGSASLLTAILLSGAAGSTLRSAPQEAGVQDPALEKLIEALRQQNVHIDPQSGAMWIPVEVDIRDELLEYLLVGPAGASHESLFTTAVPASVINTALLLLGLHPGNNASWRPKDPKPSEEEMRAGVAPYEVTLPHGDSVELYAAWRQKDELYFYRIEDLLRNVLSGASMQRHRWVYLGSKMLPPDPRRKDKAPENLFAADMYQNLINISYFSEAYTLLTAALPECVEQTIWLPNAWLVPQRGTQIALCFSRGHMDAISASLAASLPQVEPALRDARSLPQAGESKPVPPKDGH